MVLADDDGDAGAGRLFGGTNDDGLYADGDDVFPRLGGAAGLFGRG